MCHLAIYEYQYNGLNIIADNIIKARAVCNGGSVITQLKVVEYIHRKFVIAKVLNFINNRLSSEFQIIDLDVMLCIKPGSVVNDLKSEFLSKYDVNTYESKLKTFMQLL